MREGNFGNKLNKRKKNNQNKKKGDGSKQKAHLHTTFAYKICMPLF